MDDDGFRKKNGCFGRWLSFDTVSLLLYMTVKTDVVIHTEFLNMIGVVASNAYYLTTIASDRC